MSLWDEIRDGAHALYQTNVDFTDGFRSLLPSIVQVDGIPLPVDALLTGAFTNAAGSKLAQSYWETFATYLAGSLGGIAQVQQLTSAGRAAQAAGTGQDSMPALIIPNVYRVSIEALSGTQQIVNVIGVRGTATGQEHAAATAVMTAWESGFGTLCKLHNVSYVMTNYHVMDLSSATGGIYDLPSTTAGATTGDVSTVGACALIKWNGGTRSRSSSGRMYWGPLSESQVKTDGRTLDSTFQGNLQTDVGSFISSLTTAGFPLVVISRLTSSAHTVTTGSVESVIATQRRRIRS